MRMKEGLAPLRVWLRSAFGSTPRLAPLNAAAASCPPHQEAELGAACAALAASLGIGRGVAGAVRDCGGSPSPSTTALALRPAPSTAFFLAVTHTALHRQKPFVNLALCRLSCCQGRGWGRAKNEVTIEV